MPHRYLISHDSPALYITLVTKKYSLWQTEKNVLPIFTESMFMQKVNYIHQNPVRAELVERPIDCRWSSARIWQDCPMEDEPLPVDKDQLHWRRG